MSIHDIPTKGKGDRVFHGEFNDIVGFLRALPNFGRGSNGWGTRAVAPPIPASPERVVVLNNSGSTIQPFSVFLLVNAGTVLHSKEAPTFVASKLDSGSAFSPWGLYTNGSIPVANGSACWASPVGRSHPHKVLYSGTQPEPGEPVGLRPGTFTVESLGSKYRSGLVALSADSDFAWVMHASDTVLVKTDEDIPAVSGTTLGKGDATVQYRTVDADTVFVAKKWDDSGSDMTVKVFNPGELIPSGTYTRAVSVAGVGLVVERPNPADVLRGAVWLTGTFNIQSSSDIHARFQYGITDTPYTLVTHQVGDPHKDGFNIENEGRHLIFAQATFTTASPGGMHIINDGDDLCDSVTVHIGEMRLVRNDNPAAPGGTESLASEYWSEEAICAKRIFQKTIITLGWHDVDDDIKLWIDPTSVAGGYSETHWVCDVRLGAIYLGDFDVAWDA